MIILRDWHNCPADCRGAVIAIGNFDGIHTGHIAVLNKGIVLARQQKRPFMVMSFNPRPRLFFDRNAKADSLADLHQQYDILRGMGVDILMFVRFNSVFAALSPYDFVAKVLNQSLRAAHIITGDDFRYGSKRSGDSRMLTADCESHSIGYTPIAQLSAEGIRCSSSATRGFIQSGDVAAASRMLGRHYAIAGRVKRGDQRGRKLNFPTANISISDYCAPKYGVYAVTAKLSDGRTFEAVANIGTRPTFDGSNAVVLETHIPNFAEDIYGQRVEISFHKYLRAERKFSGIDELTSQIKLDIASALEYFCLRP